MARLTPDELRAAFPGPELAQALGIAAERDQTGRPVWPTPEDEALEPFIDAAHAEADAYLGARYELPLPTLPASLKQPLFDIARYRMAGGERTTEQVALRYEQAINFLKLVAKGTVSLGLPLVDDRQVGRVAATRTSTDNRTLARSQWKDW